MRDRVLSSLRFRRPPVVSAVGGCLASKPAPTIGRAKRNRAIDRSTIDARAARRTRPHTALGEWLPTTRDGRRRANRA